jgi:hypothetical protein
MEIVWFISGVPVGVATSLISWWILWRVLSPRGKFATVVSSSADLARPGRVRYRTKFLSTGRRPMMDVQFSAIMFLPNIEADGGQALIRVPVYDESTPRIGGSRRRSSSEKSVLDAPHRVITLRFSDVDQAQLIRVRGDLRRCLAHGFPGSLEAVLNSYPGASIQLVCTGSDSLTGARRAFVSLAYTAASIKAGVFKRGRTLELHEAVVAQLPERTP